MIVANLLLFLFDGERKASLASTARIQVRMNTDMVDIDSLMVESVSFRCEFCGNDDADADFSFQKEGSEGNFNTLQKEMRGRKCQILIPFDHIYD